MRGLFHPRLCSLPGVLNAIFQLVASSAPHAISHIPVTQLRLEFWRRRLSRRRLRLARNAILGKILAGHEGHLEKVDAFILSGLLAS